MNGCEHICTSDCRREGCNCQCGEWHINAEEEQDMKEMIEEWKEKDREYQKQSQLAIDDLLNK